MKLKSSAIPSLHQDFVGPGEFLDHSFAAQKASKVAAYGRLAQVVLQLSFTGYEMAGVDDILFARPQHLTMNRPK